MEADGWRQDSRIDTGRKTCWKVHHSRKVCGQWIRDLHTGGFCCLFYRNPGLVQWRVRLEPYFHALATWIRNRIERAKVCHHFWWGPACAKGKAGYQVSRERRQVRLYRNRIAYIHTQECQEYPDSEWGSEAPYVPDGLRGVQVGVRRHGHDKVASKLF